MTPRTKKTAAALTGALVLASGAYALGSQTGDGSALAGQNANASRQAGGFGYGPRPGTPGRRGPGRDLAAVAGKLGVTPAQLRAALEKLHGTQKRDFDAARTKFAADLAARLGISQAKVQAALDKRMGERKVKRDGRRGDIRDAFAQQLATKLGIDAANVRSALDDAHRSGGPPDLSTLAGKLGVTEAKLRDALQTLRPRLGRRGPGGPPGARIAALAKDLGVSEAKLRRALTGLRDDFQKQRAAEREKFAAALAAELGISKAKVDDVIGSLGHHGRRGP
jgi:transposase-like protein